MKETRKEWWEKERLKGRTWFVWKRFLLYALPSWLLTLATLRLFNVFVYTSWLRYVLIALGLLVTYATVNYVSERLKWRSYEKKYAD